MAEESGSSPGLLLGALGVVFGDIGTSPLYALRSVLGEADSRSSTTVLGMTSLVIWSLVLVVTLLYVGLLMREDNDGEGGLLALLALLRRSGSSGRAMVAASLLGMAGAALFLGDSIITPAISVLSASEGLEVASPSLSTWVVPVALLLLSGVFVLQRVGSGVIGRFYGPVMLVWFIVIAVAGAAALADNPEALQALSPAAAAQFVLDEPLTAFLSLGSVVLAVTGAEALYADLGHFGRAAITRTWLVVVLPALVVAYLGECARVMTDPGAAGDPFYAVVPSWGQIPVLVIATMATIIASEAVIAGAFTVIHQAGGLGLLPFLRTEHTSRKHGGQIYLPVANWSMAVAVLGVVLIFPSSDRLSSAYGVAVSMTILTTISLYLLHLHARGAGRSLRTALGGLMLVIVLFFVASSIPKLASGGWLPVGMGAALFVVMTTWSTGRRLLARARRAEELSATELLRDYHEHGSDGRHVVSACAVYLTDDSRVAPLALMTMEERWKVVPEVAVLLSWRVEDSPIAQAHEADVDIERFGSSSGAVVGVDVTLGYQERLDVRNVLKQAKEQHPEELADVESDSVTFFVSDEIPRLSRNGDLARWRQRLFLLLDRLSTDRVEQLALPRDRTIVIGRELNL